WLGTVSSSNGTLTRNPTTPTAPNACGGATTVTWTVTGDCGTKTCSASFTVTAAPAVVVSCASNVTEASCQTQDAINTKFTAWLATFSSSGGGNRQVSNNNTGAPNACGGSTTVTWTVTSSCEATKTCSASFTVTNAPAVVVSCASNVTEASCQTQDVINTKFTAWLATFSSSGGCNRQVSNNNTGAPNACGGSTTVTWTVTSSCEATKTCSASFTVTNAPAVLVSCASNVTEASCQTQDAINTKFTAWLATFSSSGGCNRQVSNNNTGAPNACGVSKTVTWTVTSSCEATKTCSASFTVTNPPAVVVSCASNVTEASCQTQDVINTKFTAWLATFSSSGGCNRQVSNNNTGAPNAWGGSTTVTWTVTSSCEATKTCSASFTVTAAPAVVVSCAPNVTEASCQTQDAINTKFTAWLATFSRRGGCYKHGT